MQLTGQFSIPIGQKRQLTLARTCIMNMRNKKCLEAQTSKVPTRLALLFLFCGHISDLEKEISTNNISIDGKRKNIGKRISCQSLLIMEMKKPPPHIKVFWEQQRKLLASPKFGGRYHPHIIRFCLSIHATAVYKEMRESGILVLPREKTLRDYPNFFTPRADFHPWNVEHLRSQTSQYFDIQRYVIIVFDEMKIQSKLVFDKHSSELIVFVDLGEDELNTSSFHSTELATHALVFCPRGSH